MQSLKKDYNATLIMKIINSVLLLILSITLHSQKRSLIEYYDVLNEPCDSTLAIKCSYFEYNEDNNSGVLKTFTMNNMLISEIPYINYEKEIISGIAKWYYLSGKIKREISIVESKRHGNLNTYYENGQIRRNEIYEHGEFKKGNCYTSYGLDTSYFNYEIPPNFPGNDAGLFSFMRRNLKYPITAMRKNIQGKVLVKFLCNKDGSLSNIKVIQPVHPLLDEEALRIVRLFPNFTPGKEDGEFVEVVYTIPINFTLE